MFADLKIVDSHAHFPVSDMSIREAMGIPSEERRTPLPREKSHTPVTPKGNGPKLGVSPKMKKG